MTAICKPDGIPKFKINFTSVQSGNVGMRNGANLFFNTKNIPYKKANPCAMIVALAAAATPKFKPAIISGSSPTFNNTAIVIKISGLLLSPIALHTVLIQFYQNNNNIHI